MKGPRYLKAPPTLPETVLMPTSLIDSSVFPIEWACHMMEPTYGLSEQAADMIKAQYSTGSSSGNSNSNSSSY